MDVNAFSKTSAMPHLTWRGEQLINAWKSSKSVAEFMEKMVTILTHELAVLDAMEDENGDYGLLTSIRKSTR